MNTENPDEAQRRLFEQAAYQHYLARHAAGKTADRTMPPTTPDSLFWRQSDGEYGVLMFNASWWGWLAAGKAHQHLLDTLRSVCGSLRIALGGETLTSVDAANLQAADLVLTQAGARGAAASSNKLASFPLAEMGYTNSPDSTGIFGACDWRLTVGDVRAAQAAQRMTRADEWAAQLQATAPTAPPAETDTVAVDAAALRQVLDALTGPPHLIREMQVLASGTLFAADSPITKLTDQYNAQRRTAPGSAGKDGHND